MIVFPDWLLYAMMALIYGTLAWHYKAGTAHRRRHARIERRWPDGRPSTSELSSGRRGRPGSRS
jgi:hypothetical protein